MRLNGNTFTVTGGLGNQLFIVAAADAFATQTGKPYRLNFSQVDANVASHGNSLRDFLPSTVKSSLFLPSKALSIARVLIESAIERLTPRSLKFIAPQDNVGFSRELLDFTGNKRLIRGYFQSHAYLDLGSGLIEEVFNNMKSSASWGADVSSEFGNNEVVGFHVRRGDYVAHSDSLGLLNYVNLSKRLEILKSDRPVAIFCEDIGFGRRIANEIGQRAQVIQKPNSISDFEELVAMSNCPFLVTSNSSFSFWAGRLGVKKEVYYPMPWFKHLSNPWDLAPGNWHSYDAVWEDGSADTPGSRPH